MLSSQRLWPSACNFCGVFMMNSIFRFGSTRSSARRQIASTRARRLAHRVVPASFARGDSRGFLRSPTARFIADHGGFVVQGAIDDRPGRLDAFIADKKRVITAHRIAEQAFVG